MIAFTKARLDTGFSRFYRLVLFCTNCYSDSNNGGTSCLCVEQKLIYIFHFYHLLFQGIQSLHQAGVCHRDLSLENVLIHGGSCHIIDMGMSLRTPNKPLSSSTDSHPILMPPQGTCGKFFYMAPEIYDNREAFDGFAIDVWSAGAMLFMMLTGAPAFEKPTASDPCFEWIMNGRLSEMIDAWNKQLSPEAISLLEGMLCVNANSRLTLDQVMKHPWVTGEHDVPPPPCAQ